MHEQGRLLDPVGARRREISVARTSASSIGAVAPSASRARSTVHSAGVSPGPSTTQISSPALRSNSSEKPGWPASEGRFDQTASSAASASSANPFGVVAAGAAKSGRGLIDPRHRTLPRMPRRRRRMVRRSRYSGGRSVSGHNIASISSTTPSGRSQRVREHRGIRQVFLFAEHRIGRTEPEIPAALGVKQSTEYRSASRNRADTTSRSSHRPQPSPRCGDRQSPPGARSAGTE